MSEEAVYKLLEPLLSHPSSEKIRLETERLLPEILDAPALARFTLSLKALAASGTGSDNT